MEMNKTLLFIGGDLSGIQKFIYNISSKKAMVSLKGRSAYLSGYTDRLCHGILDIALVQNSTTKDVVYCSGGKFYLIVEDQPAIRNAVDSYYAEQEEKLWAEHRGQLGLAIAYIPFIAKDNGGVIIEGIEYETIGELWKQITQKFSSLKNKKFSSLLLDKYDEFFDVILEGGETKVCAITGIEDQQCVKIDNDSDGNEIWVLPSVKNQVELGKKIRATEGFKTLEEYADGSYIGILRMDVDGLGARFVKGFKTFDEYSYFSQKLSSFFDKQLKLIQSRFKNYLNIVYAGGDDLFAVGRWDKIIDFAEEVHREFDSYMTGESLSISGGIAIVSDKYPISKSAELSGEAERSAKEYRNSKKNALAFLGECTSWEREFGQVRQMMEEFVSQINNNGVPKGLLQQLMRYAELALNDRNISYIWHETYYLTRQIDRCEKGNVAARNFLSRLRKEGLTKTKEDYRLLALASRWAELKLRTYNNS